MSYNDNNDYQKRKDNEARKKRTMIIILSTIGIVILTIIITLAVCLKRVEPGKVGVLIDYGKSTTSGQPTISKVATGSYQWINPITKRLAEYPISQQTLTMVRATEEGQVKGDDSVACQDKNGLPVNLDASILWRVNPEKAGDIYMLRPGIPLIGSFGGDIESTIVRREVRSAMAKAATGFTYDELFTDKKMAYSQKVIELLKPVLEENYIMLDNFILGEIYVPEAQTNAINAKAVAQQDAQKAFYLKQQAENEAAAAVAKAEGDKQVKIKQAEGEAAAIATIQAQLSKSPDYINYIYATNWNGIMPTTVVISGNGQVPPVILPPSTTTTTPTK